MSEIIDETITDEKAPDLGASVVDEKKPFKFPKPSEEKLSEAGPTFPDRDDTIKPKRGPGRPPKANLEAQLMQQFALIGTAVYAFNQYDGAVILKGSDSLAKSLNQLASENPKIKKALESALTASAWSAVGMAVAGITVPIAANHGMAPAHLATLFGCPAPTVNGKASRVVPDDEV